VRSGTELPHTALSFRLPPTTINYILLNYGVFNCRPHLWREAHEPA